MSSATVSPDHEVSAKVRTQCVSLWNPVDPDEEVDYRLLDAALESSDPAVRLCAIRRLSAQLGVLLDTSLDSEWRTRIMRLRDSTDPVLAEAAHWLTEWRFGVPGVMATSAERTQIAAAVHAALREDPSRLCAIAAVEPAYATRGEKYLPSPVWHGVLLAMTEQPDLFERLPPTSRRALVAVLEAQMREKHPAWDAVHIARRLSCKGAWDHVEDLSLPDEWSWTALLQHDPVAVLDALQHSYMSGSTYPSAVVRHALANAEPGNYKPAFLALLCDPSIGTLDDATLREVVLRTGTSDPDLEQTVLMAWDSPGSIVRLGDAYRQLGLLDRWLEVWRRELHTVAEHGALLSGDDNPDPLASQALRALLSFGAEALSLLTAWLPLVDCLEREVAWQLITFLARVPGEGPGIIARETDIRAHPTPSGNPWIDGLRERANDDVLEYLTRVYVTLPVVAEPEKPTVTSTMADRTHELREETLQEEVLMAGVARAADRRGR